VATKTAQRVIKGYLRRLERASRSLPRAERRELRAQIEEHLRSALPPEPSEADVRGVIERLGEPEDIVAEQYGRAGSDRARATGIGAQGVCAIVLLLIGGFLAGFGWIVGAVLLWTSQLWSTPEKLVGTLIIPGGFATGLFVTSAVGLEACGGRIYFTRGVRHVVNQCTGATSSLDHVLVVALLAFLLLGPIASAAFLIRRARLRLA
jgi:uncharacterized membrane protein